MDNRICVICGKKFTPNGPTQICCCKECAKIRQRQHQYQWQKDNWKRNEKTCQLCGKTFMPAKSAPKKYCSKECAKAGKRYQRACYRYSVGKRKTAPNIDDYKPGGKNFLQVITRTHKELKERNRKIVVKICPICGETFETNSPLKYCSPECKRAMNKYKNMLNMWRSGIAKRQPVFADYKKGGRLFSRKRGGNNDQ